MLSTPTPIDTDSTALFLDVDGTLLDIESHPDDVRATPELRDLLDRLLADLEGAMALISGRTIESLDAIFAPSCYPACGAHGAEIRLAGGASTTAIEHPMTDEALAALENFAAAHEGIVLEHKPGGASLHYRQAPGFERQARELVQRVFEEMLTGFRVIDGKMVLELAPVDANKGEAIDAVMAEAPFAGRRPVFIGDDTTDEDGFRVVNKLGGTAILVGSRTPTAATFALPDVAAVHQWLRDSVR